MTTAAPVAPAGARPVPTTANATVSREAIEHAASLVGVVPPSTVRNALYTYGRRPCTPEWARAFPDADLVAVRSAGAFAQLDRGVWRMRLSEDSAGRWRFETRVSADMRRGAQPVKVYVNLGGQILLSTLESIVDRVAASEAVAFKVSADPWGLLRPDKFVVYLPTVEAADRLRLALAPLVAQRDVQLLPFTAALDDSGAISLGFDPPQHVIDEFGEPSWRGLVCGLLEVALVDAFQRRESRPVDVALDAVRASGIDTTTWAPLDVL